MPNRLYKVDHKLAKSVPSHYVRRTGRRPVVSITFDDIPRSAAKDGAALLEQYGAVGTFYIAGSLTGRTCDGVSEATEHHTERDLQDLAQAGHDIGCHTYSHTSVWTLSPAAIKRELDQNHTYLASVLGQDLSLASFSYPFGACGVVAKHVIASRFAGVRSADPGLHTGFIDRGFLKAYKLYSNQMTEDQVRALIRETAAKKAWLILYTHDVTVGPSPYGCTPALLEAALQEARAADVEIMSVRNGFGAAVFQTPGAS